MSRATRIHHQKRIKQKVAKRIRCWNRTLNSKRIGIEANTRAICSCHKCGNPRKYYGTITRQEELFDIIEKEQDL